MIFESNLFSLVYSHSHYKLEICKKLGFKAGVFLTRHDDPLGNFIGNQFEIEETIECLHGRLPDDIKELVVKYGILKKIPIFSCSVF